jgi:hypothetical protein
MSPEKEKKEESSAAKYALIGTIITAIIGLAGTAITLYFQTVVPTKISIQSTQTAEARQTHAASITLSVTPTHTQTVTPTSPTPTPSALPALPTHPTDTATLTPIPPSATPSSTPTPVFGGLKFCINVRSVNIRSGPDIAFAAIGYLTFEDCLFFDGRNEAGTWLHVEPNQPNYLSLGGGWVRSDLVRPQDFDQLPILESPPTPTPIPTETLTPTPEG